MTHAARPDPLAWFSEARYGLFIHYGLFSLLGRGEWAMNREGISPEQYRELAAQFRAEAFDAEAIADLAVAGGMRYLVFTTMHHEGFRLYETELSDFSAPRTAAGRDLVAEIIAAARRRGLGIGLYHSLNNWADRPDGVEALESEAARERFVDAAFDRLRELVTRYRPFDILWYDGWWPFNAEGWRAREMNAMVAELQPGLLVNGRNGLPGDFATPEQHLAAPAPWRPWEACITLNESWGFHAADHAWKSPREIVSLLVKVAQGQGNLLLNIGPRGDGSIPAESVRTIREVGAWLKTNGEAIFGTDLWRVDPHRRDPDCRGDWGHYGPFTTRGSTLYLVATKPPVGTPFVINGLEAEVRGVRQLGAEGEVAYQQAGGRLEFAPGEAPPVPGELPRVYQIECDRPPAIYWTGGMRVPQCDHPRYDPVASDISW